MSAIGLKPGQPCSHPGCLSHLSHPCEGCGRLGGHIIPKVGQRYKHKKGGIYVVVALAQHTETNEKLVIYTPVAAGKIDVETIAVWARPYGMFCDGRFVEHE